MLFKAVTVNSFILPREDIGEIIDQYFERFGIEEARLLTRQASIKPAESDRQTLVVRTNFITLEAQNALLKTLEEPPLATRFIFVVPSDLILLDTLLSRFGAVEEVTEKPDNVLFDDFKALTYAERIKQIEKAVKEKDLVWQQAIKTGLVEFLTKTSDRTFLSTGEFVARKLLTRGAANKMLLEHLALSLPLESN